VGEVVEGVSSSRGVVVLGDGPGDGEGELERRDAAPGFGEIAGFEVLEVWGAGGVVGGDHVDVVFLEGLPEGGAGVRGTNGWRTFEVGGAIGDLLGGEVEVVGAGFDGDGNAGDSGSSE